MKSSTVLDRPIETTTAVRPLKALMGEQVLLRLLAPPKRRRSGLWIPDSAEQNKPSLEGSLNGRVFEGLVEACGPGRRNDNGGLIPIDAVPGDHVRFYFFADYYLHWPSDQHLIVPASCIQAIVGDAGITPLGDRVLVERLNVADKSIIIAPEIAKKTVIYGRVLSVGNGGLHPMTVEPGKTIIFSAYSGTAIEWESHDLLILKEAEIFGIIET